MACCTTTNQQQIEVLELGFYEKVGVVKNETMIVDFGLDKHSWCFHNKLATTVKGRLSVWSRSRPRPQSVDTHNLTLVQSDDSQAHTISLPR